MDDRWLSVGEIAEYFGISKDTVYAWIEKKDWQDIASDAFKRSEVDDWVHQGKAADAQQDE